MSEPLRRPPVPDDRPLRAVPDKPDATGRLSGDHWWDGDKAAHMADRPRYCPACGSALDIESGISVEYWEAENRIYHTWCKECEWTGDIIRVRRMIGHEPDDH